MLPTDPKTNGLLSFLMFLIGKSLFSSGPKKSVLNLILYFLE